MLILIIAISRIFIFIKYKANFLPVCLNIKIWWIVIWNNIKPLITCCPIRCLANLWFYSSFIFSKKAVSSLSSWNSLVSFLITSQKSCFATAFPKTFLNSSLPRLLWASTASWPTVLMALEPACLLGCTYLEPLFFLTGIHSMQGWTATIRHGVTRKRNTKRLKHTRNLFRNNLQLKDVC